MDKTFGCVPFYLAGACFFLAVGGIIFYFDHPVIAAIAGFPGVVLLGLALFTQSVLSNLKNEDMRIVMLDSDGVETEIKIRPKKKKKLRKRKN